MSPPPKGKVPRLVRTRADRPRLRPVMNWNPRRVLGRVGGSRRCAGGASHQRGVNSPAPQTADNTGLETGSCCAGARFVDGTRPSPTWDDVGNAVLQVEVDSHLHDDRRMECVPRGKHSRCCVVGAQSYADCSCGLKSTLRRSVELVPREKQVALLSGWRAIVCGYLVWIEIHTTP
jgi:hypothetical protein